MNCGVKKLDFCQIKSESWTPRVITFDKTIVNDDFEYIVENDFTGEKKVNKIDGNLDILHDDKVIINDPGLKIGRYKHQFIWIHDDRRTLIFEGILNITNTGASEICDNNCEVNFQINLCEEIIEISVRENILNIQGATIDVKSTITVDYDQSASVKNIGTKKDVELEFKIPKGKAFKFEDFTPEQIQGLKQPALDAAQTANTAAQSANAAAQTANTAAQNANDKVQELTEAVHNAKWYGIEWDVTNSSPDVTRIGDLSLHRSLPVQGRMVGALVGDDRKVVEYLSPNDWNAHDLSGSRHASQGASAGFVLSHSSYAPSRTSASLGSRLCCEENVSESAGD